MEVIDALLRIHRIREEACERTLRLARANLQEGTLALEQASQRRAEGDAQRHQAELSLYADLCNRPVQRLSLEQARQDVDIWRAEAQVDEQAEATAQQQRDTLRESYLQAGQQHRLASCATEKVAALAEQQRLGRQKEAERLADLELEEYGGRRRLPDLDETVPEVLA